jgi:hypothetical protein
MESIITKRSPIMVVIGNESVILTTDFDAPPTAGYSTKGVHGIRPYIEEDGSIWYAIDVSTDDDGSVRIPGTVVTMVSYEGYK